MLLTRDKVISAIKQKLYVEHGIDLPYPTRQILFHDQTEETDGDRSKQREGWPAGNKKVPQPRSISGSLRRLAQMRAQRNGSEAEGKGDRTSTANDGHEKRSPNSGTRSTQLLVYTNADGADRLGVHADT